MGLPLGQFALSAPGLPRSFRLGEKGRSTVVPASESSESDDCQAAANRLVVGSIDPLGIYGLEAIGAIIGTENPKRFLKYHGIKPLGGIREERYYGNDIIKGIQNTRRKYESAKYGKAKKASPRKPMQNRQDRTGESCSTRGEDGNDIAEVFRQECWGE